MAGVNNTKNSNKWIVLCISFLLMLVFAISLQSLPPIFSNIMKDIPFSNSQAGLLMSSYSIIGIFIPFLVAIFLSKFDLKKMLLVALLLVVAGLVGFSLSSSYMLLFFCRLLSGSGATIIAVLSPLLITMFFDQNNMGIAMGVFNTAVPLGTVVSANLFGYLGLFLEWTSIIRGIAIFAAIVLAIVLFFLAVPDEREKKNSAPIKLNFNLSSSLWFLAIIWMIANGQLLAYTTFAPQFFQTMGLTAQRSGFLTSMIMFVSIFLTPIIGIMIDKINRKKIFLLIGIIIMAVSFAFISTDLLTHSFWTVFLGVGFSLVPVCIFALLPELGDPENMNMGMAAITAASNLGITIGPLGFGTLLDTTSTNFTLGFIILGVFSLIGAFAALRIKTKHT